MRTHYDFSPFRRSAIGFDRLFDLLETAAKPEPADGYPPFDLCQDGDDRYEIRLAVAGFARQDIEVVAQQNLLVVRGHKAEAEDEGRFLHRGIAARPFERQFHLADFIKVGQARFEHGLLVISLRREVPEAMKPRRIDIAGAAANDRIEAPTGDQHAA
jgi:molecular chaperone IbpA